MLARGHDGTDDTNENPSKKPRLSGPSPNSNTTGPSAPLPAASTAASVPQMNPSYNPPKDIHDFQIVQQNIKKSGSPPAPMASTSATGNTSLDDIKKEDLDFNGDSLFNLDELDGIDLENLCSELNMEDMKVENGGSTSFFGADDLDFFTNATADVVSTTPPASCDNLVNSFRNQVPYNVNNSSVLPVASSMAGPSASSLPAPISSSFQNNSSLPQKLGGGLQCLGQEAAATTTTNPAATTLKNMAQVHQKQQHGLPVRPSQQPYAAAADFNNFSQQPQMGASVAQNGCHPMYNNSNSSLQQQTLYNNNTQQQQNISEMELKKRQMMQMGGHHLQQQQSPLMQQQQNNNNNSNSSATAAINSVQTQQQQQQMQLQQRVATVVDTSCSIAMSTSTATINSINSYINSTSTATINSYINSTSTAKSVACSAAATVVPNTDVINNSSAVCNTINNSNAVCNTINNSSAVCNTMGHADQHMAMMGGMSMSMAQQPTGSFPMSRMSPVYHQAGPQYGSAGGPMRAGVRPSATAYHRQPSPGTQVSCAQHFNF